MTKEQIKENKRLQDIYWLTIKEIVRLKLQLKKQERKLVKHKQLCKL